MARKTKSGANDAKAIKNTWPLALGLGLAGLALIVLTLLNTEPLRERFAFFSGILIGASTLVGLFKPLFGDWSGFGDSFFSALQRRGGNLRGLRVWLWVWLIIGAGFITYMSLKGSP